MRWSTAGYCAESAATRRIVRSARSRAARHAGVGAEPAGRTQAQDLAERTASALIASRQSEAAFTLLTEIGSTARAIDVMRQLAERYAEQGQVELLTGSIAKLPTDEVQRDAWLCFWTGQALLGLMKSRRACGSDTPTRRSKLAI